MGYIFSNVLYVFSDIEAPFGFKIKYLTEKFLKAAVRMINKVPGLHIKTPYLFNEDYVLKTKHGIWKIRHHTDFDYAIKPIFESDLQPYFECDNGIFLDIGAHIGKWSVFVGMKYPKCDVYAFEPNRRTFGYLEENIALNKLSNVNIYNVGLSDIDGALPFAAEEEFSGISKFKRDLIGADNITAEVVRLDSFIKSGNINPREINLMKIDVEGHEFEVLKGARNTLASMKKGTRIICEILDSQSQKQDIIGFMEKLNFDHNVLETKCDFLFSKNN